MKYIRNFNSLNSAKAATLYSPTLAEIKQDGNSKLLAMNTGVSNQELQITGNSLDNCGINVKPTGPTYEYVDLGLASGTLWLICNLGATQPYEYGDYYAWGEIEPYYESITWSGTEPTVTWKSGKEAGYADDYSNYKYYSDGEFTKYNETDGKTELETGTNGDDAIWIATNGQYKIPTLAQIQELVTLSSEWTMQGGVYGRLFTGNNSNTLFIPASGVFDGDQVYTVGNGGGAWSSTLVASNASSAWEVGFGSGGVIESYCDRYGGIALRGVKS